MCVYVHVPDCNCLTRKIVCTYLFESHVIHYRITYYIIQALTHTDSWSISSNEVHGMRVLSTANSLVFFLVLSIVLLVL